MEWERWRSERPGWWNSLDAATTAGSFDSWALQGHILGLKGNIMPHNVWYQDGWELGLQGSGRQEATGRGGNPCAVPERWWPEDVTLSLPNLTFWREPRTWGFPFFFKVSSIFVAKVSVYNFYTEFPHVRHSVSSILQNIFKDLF